MGTFGERRTIPETPQRLVPRGILRLWQSGTFDRFEILWRLLSIIDISKSWSSLGCHGESQRETMGNTQGTPAGPHETPWGLFLHSQDTAVSHGMPWDPSRVRDNSRGPTGNNKIPRTNGGVSHGFPRGASRAATDQMVYLFIAFPWVPSRFPVRTRDKSHITYIAIMIMQLLVHFPGIVLQQNLFGTWGLAQWSPAVNSSRGGSHNMQQTLFRM